VIYDAGEAETSEGPRPLPVRRYFARLTQALITALSAPMAEGRLYEVDMRLRPSGNQGPVATSLASFRQYQRDEAWTWEYLALTRAAVIAGPEGLAREVSGFIAERLAEPRDAAVLAADVLKMRLRIAEAKPSGGWLDIKAGPGRMQDIELLGQLGVLVGGAGSGTELDHGLASLVQRGVLTGPARGVLADAHDLYWRVQQAGRLLAPDLRDESGLGPSGVEALLRITEQPSLARLQETLADGQVAAARVIDETLAALVATGEQSGDAT
jgi:glutamate-ammonia-ligase adenylyltransferase